MALFVAKGESGFQRLPKGKQILLVKGVEFDPDFFTDTMAEVVVVLATQSGITHKETFNVASEGGAKAFTFMIKTIHNRFDIKEGESLDELVETAAGNYIETTVEWMDVGSGKRARYWLRKRGWKRDLPRRQKRDRSDWYAWRS